MVPRLTTASTGAVYLKFTCAMHEHFVASLCYPQAALSLRGRVAMVVAAYVQQPLSKAHAHVSRVRVAIQYAAVIFATIAEHYDQPSSQSYQGYSGIVASSVVARLCRHGKTYSQHIPPNQATPHRLHSGPPLLHRQTWGLGTHPQLGQTSQHPS